MAAAIGRANTRFLEQQNRVPANSNRLSGFQLQNLGFQANDVATMALMGASPGQIAVSQGGQILQTLQMGEGGIAGSLNAIKGSAVAAGTALAGMLGTTGLIATGFGAAAVAAGAFYLATREKAKELNAILSEQKDIVQSLGPAYEGLSRIGQNGPFENPGVARLALQANLVDARKAMTEQVQAALKETSGSGGTFLSLIGALPEGVQSALGRSQTSIEFERIMDSASRGETSINDARAALVKFGQEHPDFSYIIGRFISMTSTAAATERQVKSLENTVNGLGDPSRASVGFDRIQQFGRDQSTMRQRFGDDPFAAQREDQRQKVISLKEAQDERNRSLDRTIASAQLDIALTGKTAPEAAGFVERYARKTRKDRQ
ncbi:phage tail length tape measure family protein [Mesorhizobium sp. WSM3879]|uniref:phage tail length tape measure family protein n=1 Tax=Mesorhizobium sp. WSM3879 TaxID=2029406 RepID=UPI0015C6A056|nr:phage tail length tape measure family protein [Mesorhizobium sp. WSM3879]